jgi:PTS system nitrogen regulatory IIA component
VVTDRGLIAAYLLDSLFESLDEQAVSYTLFDGTQEPVGLMNVRENFCRKTKEMKVSEAFLDRTRPIKIHQSNRLLVRDDPHRALKRHSSRVYIFLGQNLYLSVSTPAFARHTTHSQKTGALHGSSRMQLSIKDVARLIDTDENTIYQWIRQDNIPYFRINDEYRFNRADLLEWATGRRLKFNANMFIDDDQEATSMPGIAQALEVGGVMHRVGGTDQASVLRSVVNAMRLPETVDKDFLYSVLLARETLGSTGVGGGIAIPHVRNPVVLHIATPSATLCFLENAIDFKAIDGKPVNILFTLISPTVQMHLHLLSRLGLVLRDSDFRDALDRKAPVEEILAIAAGVEARVSPPAPASEKSGS